jgi:hypothetical protein
MARTEGDDIEDLILFAERELDGVMREIDEVMELVGALGKKLSAAKRKLMNLKEEKSNRDSAPIKKMKTSHSDEKQGEL